MQDSQQKPDMRHRLQEEMNQEINPLVEKIQKHLKKIALVIGGIILISASVTGYRYYKQKALTQAKETFSQILVQKQGAEKIAALEGFLDEAPGSMQRGVRLELAKSCLEQKRYSQAAAHWKQVAETAPQGSNMAVIAKLGQAKALRLNGQPAESLELLKELAETVSETYERSVNMELAVTAEEAEDWSTALQAYRALQSQTELADRRDDYFQYKISQLEEKTGAGTAHNEQTSP